MRLSSQRAFAIPAVVWLIAALGGGAMVAVPNWRPANWFKKDQVATANVELQKAQADLAKAQADSEAAQTALRNAQAAELAKKDAQIRYAQQMTVGAAESLTKAPPSPPVALAQSLLGRANPALVLAIGGLPEAQQTEILNVVAQSLSGLTDQLAQASATLTARDKELAVVTTDRAALQKQIPALQTQLAAKDAAVIAQITTVAEKTQQVVMQAEKIAAKEKEAGSLTAQVNNLGRILIIAGILYLFAHFLLPSLAQEFPNSVVLNWANKTTKSLTSAHE